MYVPISWLKEYVDLTLPTPDLAERITLAGLEVAGVTQVGDWWDPETLVVGQVLAVHEHPDADRLVLVDVDAGDPAPQRVVTGAPNLYQYKHASDLPMLKVAFAKRGAVLVDAYSDERPRPKKKLKPAKIRGIKSEGMVCSELELGLSEEHEGIMLLAEDAPVGTPLSVYLGDQVLEVELTPDMARCLSMVGTAREVAALTESALHLPADELTTTGDDTAADYVAVEIADPALCNRYTALIIRNVTIGPSPAWMQDRLRKSGMRPISNIVDITNYVMLEQGQPLHAFDYDLLAQRAQESGAAKPTIIVRSGQDGEKMTTLDGQDRVLDQTTLLITDTGGPIALAGVMGGLQTEVHNGTRTILLESATFEGINNRRTAQRLKLHSEASGRFTKGVPATLNPIAARRAADLMRRYAGGEVVPGMVDTYPVTQTPPVVYSTESEVRRQLGMEISLDQVADALARLDFQVKKVNDVAATAHLDATFGLSRRKGEALVEATAPWHRLDIRFPADLTEEVARIIGYEKVGTTLMADVLPTQHHNAGQETQETLRDLLIGCGLQDTINYALTTPENHAKLNQRQAEAPTYIELANPLTPERRALRRTLLVSALENLAHNSRFTDRLAAFELGRVYWPEQGDGVRPKEERRVSILLTGSRRAGNFHPDPTGEESFDFFDLKGVVETLIQRIGFSLGDLEFRVAPDSGTFGPRCATLWLKGERMGILGEVHPQVRANFGLGEGRVCLAELDVAPLIRPTWSLHVMDPISIYPPVMEDLAFEVAEAITSRRVIDAMRTAGGVLLSDIELFDIYRGKPIADGRKSMAYRLTYQSHDKSLTEKEIARLRGDIVQAVEAETGGTLRG
ncbi:MAG: phenylalanine--tRNA ligase subunit beta [Caldilineaceae bacterium]|nr:phenylalanine--tRNA ligase subunit beta [Caldilineaceae bacterium]